MTHASIYIADKIVLLILNCFWIASYAESTIEFEQLKGENVPTQSITYAIDTDSIGNVWIASEEGVLKHNSKYYTIYNSYNGLPTIFGNRIKEVFVDSKQRVWIGSEEGVSIYNENSDASEYIETDGVLNPSLISSYFQRPLYPPTQISLLSSSIITSINDGFNTPSVSIYSKASEFSL